MIVGIDIGVTYSSICILDKYKFSEPVILSKRKSIFENDYALPSAIYVEDGKILVGYEAIKQRINNPENYKAEFKRDIGQNIPYKIGEQRLLPQDLYKEIFVHLKKCAEDYSGESVERTFLTYPASYNSKKKDLIKHAAQNAGFPRIELIDEPSAAAIFYSTEYGINNDDKILVYDFGGGTFKAALLEFKKGRFTPLTQPMEIEGCGGAEIDRLIFNEIIHRIDQDIYEEIKSSPADFKKFKADLNDLSIRIKHELSYRELFEEKIKAGDSIIDFSIERKDLNSLISGIVDETITCVQSIIKKASLRVQDIAVILPVGGSSRLPLVKEKLEKLFKKQINVVNNADIAAALGAVRYGVIKDPSSVYSFSKDDEITACKSCGSAVPPHITFCLKCGKVKEFPEYITADMKEQYQKRIEEFILDLKKSDNSSENILWNATVARYIETVKQAQSIAKSNDLNKYFTNNFFSELDVFIQRCATKEYHVALIGAIKAGKSTLINAILDREVASTSVTPETASLTKFRTSEKDYINVSFYNKSEWRELWKSVELADTDVNVFKDDYAALNAKKYEQEWIGHKDFYKDFENEEKLKMSIKEWTSSKSPKHYFVKEVEVGLKDWDVPKEVIFVDTPGLDDPVQYRSDITRKYIDRANIVVVCVNAKTLPGQELETIYKVFANTRYNPEKVFVIGTQIDLLNNIERDWEDIRHEWLKHLSGINCFNNKILAKKNLIHVAAYLHTLLNKYEADPNGLSKYEMGVLIPAMMKLMSTWDKNEIDKPEVRLEMRRMINLNQVKDSLMGDAIKKANRYIIQDIAEKYKLLKEEISMSFTEVKKQQFELIEGFNKGIDDIHNKLKEKQRSMKEIQKEKMELDNLLTELKNKTEKQASELIKRIQSIEIN